MKWLRTSWRAASSASMVCLAAGTMLGQAAAQVPPAPPTARTVSTVGTVTVERLPAGVEVLMRGPVHQAFAQPYPQNEAMVRIQRPVPAPLMERPAAARPNDAERTAQWIPGYWAVDPESEDVLWVSGIWRFAPPGMQWVPGYWDTQSAESTWVSGFWVDERTEELEFVSRPPEPKETVPASDPPSDRHFWVPGYWVHDRGEFAWEPGTWGEAQQGWVWEAARYLQTPSGWVFVDGYWDYEPADRGLLFAPVRFDRATVQVTQEVRRPVLLEGTYLPQVAIEPRQAMVHWFAQPAYTHYYFGNYYDPTFAQRGLVPWVGYQQRPDYYDPLFWYFRATQPTVLTQLVQSRNRVIAQPSLLPASVFRTDIAAAQLPSYVQTIDTLLSGERSAEFTRVEASVLDEYSQRLQGYDTFTSERLALRARLGDEAAARAQTEERQANQRQGADQDGRPRRRGDAASTEQPNPSDPGRDSEERRMQPRGDRPQQDIPEGDVAPERPGATPERPSATPDRPSATPERPGATPERPGATPERPGATPERPGTTPERPGATPERPGAAPERPGTTPERPGTTPERPGATPERPGATPERPGTTPERPGATPERPSATPERPGEASTTPSRSGAASDRSGTSPGSGSAGRADSPGTQGRAVEQAGEMSRRQRTADRAGSSSDEGQRNVPAGPRGTLGAPSTPQVPGARGSSASSDSAAGAEIGIGGSAQTQGTAETRSLSETSGSGESRGTTQMRNLSETSGAARGGLNAVTSGAPRGTLPGQSGELPSELLQRRQAEQALDGLTPGQRMSLNRLRQIQMPENLPRAQGVPEGRQPRFNPPQRLGRPGLQPPSSGRGSGILQGGSSGVPEGQTPPDVR